MFMEGEWSEISSTLPSYLQLTGWKGTRLVQFAQQNPVLFANLLEVTVTAHMQDKYL